MSADNRFLEGSFAPVAEEITAFDLPVTGQVPAGLSGRYLRNGPNPLGLDDPNYHWFLGAGMVHGVRLRDGKAEWYRNRWVRSKAVAGTLGGTLPGGFAAHTKLDARTGELHAIAYFWAWDHVQHVVVNAAGQVSRTTDLPAPDGPMMHDFALTEKYVVFFDLPVTFSLDAVSAGRELPYTWNPAHQARVGQ